MARCPSRPRSPRSPGAGPGPRIPAADTGGSGAPSRLGGLRRAGTSRGPAAGFGAQGRAVPVCVGRAENRQPPPEPRGGGAEPPGRSGRPPACSFRFQRPVLLFPVTLLLVPSNRYFGGGFKRHQVGRVARERCSRRRLSRRSSSAWRDGARSHIAERGERRCENAAALCSPRPDERL